MTSVCYKASRWRFNQFLLSRAALARTLPRSAWMPYGLAVCIALMGSMFMMLQMIGAGLTLWAGAAIIPEGWATAQTYHRMCNDIKNNSAPVLTVPNSLPVLGVSAFVEPTVLPPFRNSESAE